MLRALPPIAMGHELAIAVVALLVVGLGALADPRPLHLGAAAALIGFGLFRFVKPRAHPRWTTMRVTRRELTWWSFLMSSAHGAGLMVAPVLLGAGGADTAQAHAGHVHVGAMLAVMAVVALVVYEKLGLAFLRKAWVSSDQFWAGAFVVAGLVTLAS